VKQDYLWVGHRCLTCNDVSIAREPGPGLCAATVCNGFGTARSTLTGIAAVKPAMGLTTETTRHVAAEAEPTKLPPKPFATLGANALLRFKDWRAGAE
jgi:hypothetical protein